MGYCSNRSYSVFIPSSWTLSSGSPIVDSRWAVEQTRNLKHAGDAVFTISADKHAGQSGDLYWIRPPA
eukprot:9872069-Alexandrium_andersonii.AAC.1